MGFANVQSTDLDLSGGGTKSVAHDPGGTVNYCVVELGGGSADFTASVTFGGVTIPERASARDGWFGRGDSRVRIYAYTDEDGSALPSTSSTFQVVVSGTPNGGKARIWTGLVSGASALGEVYSDTAGAVKALNNDFDPPADAPFSRIYFAIGGNMGLPSIGATWGVCTVEANYTHANAYGFTGNGGLAAEQSDGMGTRNAGIGNISFTAAVGLLIYSSAPEVSPDRFGAEAGFNAPAIGYEGPVVLYMSRLKAVEVGMRPGVFSSRSKRQVSLVGEGLDTAEMTVDGDEGDILTQHADRNPTWEVPDAHVHASHWEPVRMDTDGDGVLDDWVFFDDGDIVMLKVEE